MLKANIRYFFLSNTLLSIRLATFELNILCLNFFLKLFKQLNT